MKNLNNQEWVQMTMEEAIVEVEKLNEENKLLKLYEKTLETLEKRLENSKKRRDLEIKSYGICNPYTLHNIKTDEELIPKYKKLIKETMKG